MTNETYQLIDTALKIGLASLITGISSYLILGKQFLNDRAKLNLECKRSLIIALAESFELVDDGIDKIAIEFRAHFNSEKDELDMQSIKESAIQSFKCLRVGKANSNLLGLSELHSELDKYSYELNQLLNYIEDYLETGNESNAVESHAKINSLKQSIYPLIAKGFSSISA